MASAIRIAVLANASQAKRELNDVSTRGQKFSKVLGAASKIAAVGLLAVGAAAVKAGKAAADDQAGQARLAQTLRTAAGATTGQVASTEKWIAAQGKALGVSDDELRPAIAKLATATGSVAKAQKLASLAMNISTGSGKSLESVTAALAKAQSTGSVTALAKYGVATKDADGKTRSLADITRDLASKYQGAAAKAAQTTAGKQRILSVQMGELQETIGAGLLPVMSKLATAGLAVVNSASKHTTAAKILTGVLVGTAVAVLAISGAMKVATAAQAAYTAVTATVAVAQRALTAASLGTRIGLAALTVQQYATAVAAKVAAAGQWLLNAAMAANPIGLVILAIVALVAVFVIAYKKSETFRAIVQKAWAGIRAATSAVWGFLKALTSRTWNAIRNTIRNVVTAVAAVVRRNVAVASAVVVAGWALIKNATSRVWNTIRNVIRGVVQGIAGIVRRNVNAAKTAVTGAWGTVKTSTGKVWSGVKTAVSNAVTDVVKKVKGLHDKLTNALAGAGSWLTGAGKALLTGMIGGIKDKAGDVAAAAVSAVKAAIRAAKGALKIGSPSRVFRQFGRWTSEGLALGIRDQAGLAGKAASRLSRAVAAGFSAPGLVLDATAALTASGAGAGGSVTYQINVSVAPTADRAAVGREIVSAIDAYTKAGGRRAA